VVNILLREAAKELRSFFVVGIRQGFRIQVGNLGDGRPARRTARFASPAMRSGDPTAAFLTAFSGVFGHG
jgi:hypothetical protein